MRCPDWCGIWYWADPWSPRPKRFKKTTKPYTGEVAFQRKRALYFCTQACANAGTALNPVDRNRIRTT